MRISLMIAVVVVPCVALVPLPSLVAGARCYPSTRFEVLDSSLVRDTLTQLVWQQRSSSAPMTWAEAQSYCSKAGAAASEFRLPTVKELESLLDFKGNVPPLIERAIFSSTVAGYYWTGSRFFSEPSRGNSVWSVTFLDGTIAYNDAGEAQWVRCVRGRGP